MARSIATLLLLVLAGGCGNTSTISSNATLIPEADAGDAGDESPACEGRCLPKGPSGFTPEPFLLWMGENHPAALPPACPDATETFYEGLGELNAPLTCETCTCGPSPCILPAGAVRSLQKHCDGPDFFPIDTPPDWDGSCVASPLPPFYVTTSIHFMETRVGPCEPAPPAPKPAPPQWMKRFLGCRIEAQPCSIGDDVCFSQEVPPPSGFAYCISAQDQGETECPVEYPEKYLGYQGVTDERSCTPCECGSPTGNQCDAYVRGYTDTDCVVSSTGQSVDQYPDQSCYSIINNGSILVQSLSATWQENTPGTCEAHGGEPMGQATPLGATTFCCRPPEP